MQFFPIIMLFLLFFKPTSLQQCKPRLNDSNAFRCVGKDGISDVSASECKSRPNCCLSRGVCYAKVSKTPKAIEKEKNDQQMMKDFKKLMTQITPKSLSLLTPPSLPWGGGDPYPGFSSVPAFACAVPPDFPASCYRTDAASARFVKSPPNDIPYCVRIPCDPKQPSLDEKPDSCREKPGCYFDKELSDYRRRIGDSALPGVPVCHLAIRNAVFQSEASKMVKETGKWSPFFTECLLTKLDGPIRAPKDGCSYLSVLTYFQQKPKKAGWLGMKEYDCVLIDGCWVKNKGCFYPADPSKLTVGILNAEEEKTASALYYGRPKCQDFDRRTAKSTVKSFHNCLLAGCKLDKYAKKSYYNYLYNYGKTMKGSDHWIFWREVQSGRIGAHNIDQYQDKPKQDSTITPFSLVIPYPPKQNEPNLLSELLQPGYTSILDIIKEDKDVKSISNSPGNFFESIKGIQMPCSSSIATFGARPCAPDPYEPTDVPQYCPYKQIKIKDLKPLKGSFSGCCAVNLCYLPKDEIPSARSGSAMYYSEWSYWTECSETCGKGEKRRWRKCLGIDQSKCTEPLNQTEKCEQMLCSSWAIWGGWSECGVTCESGIQTRKRRCKPDGATCPGESDEVQQCHMGPCSSQKFGIWSQWINSCEPCGKTTYRTRSCLIKPCSDDDIYETKRCPKRCGEWQNWSPYSGCQYNFFLGFCQKFRTRICLNSNQQMATCLGVSTEYENCTPC